MERPDFGALSVICLDDNSFMHELMRTMLAAFRIKDVRFALNSKEAFELMCLRCPDLMIVDLALQEEDGAAFIEKVRRAEDSPDPYVQIIALSAYTDKGRVTAARDAGATEVLAKPLSARTLYDRLCYMAKHNRPFIKAAGYAGPDRRRRERDFDGGNRRSTTDSEAPDDGT